MLNWPCFILVSFSLSWLWFCHRLCPWINKRTVTETESRLRIFSRSPHVHLTEKIHFYFNQPDTQAAQRLIFHFHRCNVYFYASWLFAYILHTYSNPKLGLWTCRKGQSQVYYLMWPLLSLSRDLPAWSHQMSQVISCVIKTRFLLFSCNLTPSTFSFSCNFRHKCHRENNVR